MAAPCVGKAAGSGSAVGPGYTGAWLHALSPSASTSSRLTALGRTAMSGHLATEGGHQILAQAGEVAG